MAGSLQRRLAFAKKASEKAGMLAASMRRNRRNNEFVQTKGDQDFVTLADKAVEDLIREMISQRFPDDAILGEEAGTSGAGDNIWVIDPIDGTTNYLKGLPDWAVSIAYVENDLIQIGVIYAPDHRQLAWSVQGSGAFLNGKKIQVTSP